MQGGGGLPGRETGRRKRCCWNWAMRAWPSTRPSGVEVDLAPAVFPRLVLTDRPRVWSSSSRLAFVPRGANALGVGVQLRCIGVTGWGLALFFHLFACSFFCHPITNMIHSNNRKYINKLRTPLRGLKVLNLSNAFQSFAFSLSHFFMVASGGFEPPVSGL